MLHTPIRPGTALLLAAALSLLPGAALAQTLAGNDEIEGATPIGIPDRVEDQDTSGATASPDDPQSCWSGYTVWFRAVAPEDGTLRTDAFASIVTEEGGPFDLPTGFAVFTGEPGALVELGCSVRVFGQGGPVDAPVQAGDVVHIVAGALQANSAGTAVDLDVRYLRAPRIDVTVDRVGTVRRDSVATVTGTLRCDVDTTALLSLTLRQPSRQPQGGAASVGCTRETSRWSLELPVTEGSRGVHPGRAVVEGVVTAGDQDPTSSSPVSASVVLRPTHAGGG